jgi:uncharacterized membrane protein
MTENKDINIKGRFWRALTPKECAIFTVCLIAAYGIIFSFFCIRKYITFGYRDWDLAIYANILWNLVHGKVYSSLFANNFLLDHSSMIAFVIAVPYFIFRHPVFLLVLQSFAIAVSAFPIFFTSRRKLDDLSAVILTLLYLCYPALHYANLYEFNFEIFALPFLSFAFYFLLENRQALFLLMCVGASSCKENIPFTVAALGVFGLFRPRRRLLGLGAMLVGSGFFLFNIYILPLTAGGGTISPAGTSSYLWLFSAYGNSPFAVISYVLAHPAQTLRTIFSNGIRHKLFYDTLGVLFFLPLLRPDILLVNGPHILIRLLSSDAREQTIYFHSAAILAPFVFFAAIFSLHTIFRRLKKISDYRYHLLAVLLFFEIACAAYIWINRPEIARFRLYVNEEDAVRQNFIDNIPRTDAVVATFGPLSHLANRDKIYSLHSFFGLIGGGKALPETASYLMFEPAAGLLPSFSKTRGCFDEKLMPYLAENNFSLVKARGDMLLFKKGAADNQKLFEIEKEAGPRDGPAILKVGGEIALANVKTKYMRDGGGLLWIAFYWRPETVRTHDYLVRLIVKQNDRVVSYSDHMLGYYLYPPSVWNKGDMVKENYWLILPKLPAGKYVLSSVFLDIDTDKAGAEYTLCDFTV